MSGSKVAMLHYSAPPVVGGVEAVMLAHARAFSQAGHAVTFIAGRGDAAPGAEVDLIPELDSRHPAIESISRELAHGRVPPDFDRMVEHIANILRPRLKSFDSLIVHNVLTKHFNLPLTTALHRLLDAGGLPHTLAWCHDFTWASPSSQKKVHAGYPWELLRTYRSDMTYVTVSRERQQTLAQLLACPPDRVHVAYNGVDPEQLLGVSGQGRALMERLDLAGGDLILIMPVRVTRAKNIEYALRVVGALKALNCAPRLVVTGPPDPHDAASLAYYESLRTLRRTLELEAEARFVYESGPEPDRPCIIEWPLVAELLRTSDVMFMPSHREGFGMPILEAGLIGLPVASAAVPAAVELGGGDVLRFDPTLEPDQLARELLDWLARNPQHRLRQRVRRQYTWQAIFQRDIEPLLRPTA